MPSTTCYAWRFSGPVTSPIPDHDRQWFALPDGMRVAARATSALRHATIASVSVFRCRGDFEGEVFACSDAEVVVAGDATAALRLFARACARSVAHLWSPDPVTTRWIDHGDEAVRAHVHRTAWERSFEVEGVARLAARVAMYAAHESLVASATREAARLALLLGSSFPVGPAPLLATLERVLAAATLRGAERVASALAA